MIRALYSAGSGMNAQQMSIDNIANNLANANTTGFKARRTQFQDLLYQSFLQPGAAGGIANRGAQRIAARPGHAAGGQLHRLYAGHFHGNRQSAGSDDPGQGILPGPAARRHHRLHARRELPARQKRQHRRPPTATRSSPQITIPAQAQTITIASDGTVSYTQPGQTAATIAGQIQLANFVNPGGLNSVGNGLFLPTDASGEPIIGIPGGADGLGTLAAGVPGIVQRQHRRGVRQHDHQPARLRSQHQGGQGGRRNVSAGEQRDTMILAI